MYTYSMSAFYENISCNKNMKLNYKVRLGSVLVSEGVIMSSSDEEIRRKRSKSREKSRYRPPQCVAEPDPYWIHTCNYRIKKEAKGARI